MQAAKLVDGAEGKEAKAWFLSGRSAEAGAWVIASGSDGTKRTDEEAKAAASLRLGLNVLGFQGKRSVSTRNTTTRG